ncbi:MAG: hypothetical protein GuCV1_gp1 [Guiyang chuvirus 1]|nr:MAG: hypothetical protein GuCV1_gp1 [Guiyang chuvirus 1]
MMCISLGIVLWFTTLSSGALPKVVEYSKPDLGLVMSSDGYVIVPRGNVVILSAISKSTIDMINMPAFNEMTLAINTSVSSICTAGESLRHRIVQITNGDEIPEYRRAIQLQVNKLCDARELVQDPTSTIESHYQQLLSTYAGLITQLYPGNEQSPITQPERSKRSTSRLDFDAHNGKLTYERTEDSSALQNLLSARDTQNSNPIKIAAEHTACDREFRTCVEEFRATQTSIPISGPFNKIQPVSPVPVSTSTLPPIEWPIVQRADNNTKSSQDRRTAARLIMSSPSETVTIDETINSQLVEIRVGNSILRFAPSEMHAAQSVLPSLYEHFGKSPAPTRHRRALLKFMGLAGNWLYGIATEDQLKAISNKVTSINQIFNTSQVQLDELRSHQVLILNQLDSAIRDLTLDIDTMQKTIKAKFEEMALDIKNITEALRILELHDQMLTAINSFSQSLDLIHIQLNVMSQKTSQGIALYTALSQLSTHNRIPLGLFSMQQSLDLYELANNCTPTGMELVYQSDKMNIVNLPNVRVLKNAEGIVISIPFPYGRQTDTFELIQVRGIPIVVNGSWYMPAVAGKYLIVDRIIHRYTVITEVMYQLCLHHPLKLCMPPQVWYDLRSDGCLGIITQYELGAVESCLLDRLSGEPPLSSRLIRIKSDQWYYSPLSTGGTLVSTCITSGKLIEDHKTIYLPAAIHVAPNCNVNVESAIIMGEEVIVSGNSYTLRKDVNFSAAWYHPENDHKLNITALFSGLNQTMETRRPAFNLDFNTIAGRNDPKISFKKLRNDIMREQEVYRDQYSLLTKKLATLPEPEYSPDINIVQYLLSWLPDWGKWAIGILLIIISGGILIRCVPALVASHNHRLAAPIAFTQLAKSIPTGYALSLVSPGSNNKTESVLIPTIARARFIAELSHSTSRLISLVHQESLNWKGQVILILDLIPVWIHCYFALVICIVVGLVMHHRVIRKLIILGSRTSKYYPWNSSANYIPSETEIILMITLKFTRALGLRDKITTAGYRVATLPNMPDSWKVTSGARRSLFFSSKSPLMRWNTKTHIGLVWSPTTICIRHISDPTIETCHDMPKQLTIWVKDLDQACEGNCPTLWYQVEIVGLVGIFAQRGSSSKMLYSDIIREQDPLSRIQHHQPNDLSVPLLSYRNNIV